MGNCLVTKLKASVDNNELLKLGELRIGFGQNDGTYDTYINFKEDQNLEVIAGTGNISTPSPSDKIVIDGNIIHVAASEGTGGGCFSSSANDGIVSIPNKYLLTRIFLNANSWGDLSIDDLKYSSFLTNLYVPETTAINITGNISSVAQCTSQLKLIKTNITGDISALNNNYKSVDLGSTNVYGNISSLANSTNLTLLSLNNTSVNGNIKSLSNCINLTSIYCYKTNIIGSYESLVEGQCAAGRTSATISITTSNCTINGSSATVSTTHYIDFNDTGANIRKYGVTTPIATYTKNTNTWTYA